VPAGASAIDAWNMFLIRSGIGITLFAHGEAGNMGLDQLDTAREAARAGCAVERLGTA